VLKRHAPPRAFDDLASVTAQPGRSPRWRRPPLRVTYLLVDAEHSCTLLVPAVMPTVTRPSGGTVFGEALELTVTVLPRSQPQQRQSGFPVGGCLNARAGQPGAHGIHSDGAHVAQVELQQLAGGRGRTGAQVSESVIAGWARRRSPGGVRGSRTVQEAPLKTPKPCQLSRRGAARLKAADPVVARRADPQ